MSSFDQTKMDIVLFHSQIAVTSPPLRSILLVQTLEADYNESTYDLAIAAEYKHNPER